MFSDCKTLEEAKQRWRALSRQHHPDRGGDPELFHQAKTAYEDAVKWLTTPIKCPDCNGKGKRLVKEAWSFHSTTLPCKPCKGTGKIIRGDDP